MFLRIHFSLFDRIALSILAGLLLLIGLLVWRGEQIGLRVLSISPADGAQDVSIAAEPAVTFNQKLVTRSGIGFSINPPISGTIYQEGETLAFLPSTGLAPNTTYQVTLPAGIVSQEGRQLRRAVTWQFKTGQPQVVYLTPDDQNNTQLFLIGLADESSIALTDEPFGVIDYSFGPDGKTIVYAAPKEDGSGALRTVNIKTNQHELLLDCGELDCAGPVWSPDGQRILYAQRKLSGPPRLYWLDTESGESSLVFDDPQVLGFEARWSPDGDWFNYVAPMEQGVRVYNITDGRERFLPSQMGRAAVWSPDGESLLLTDIQTLEGRFAVPMFRVDLADGQVTNLSGDQLVEDASPVWSPDGQWIAFGRTFSDISAGQQLWLMRANGSDAHALTDEPEIYSGSPAWSPDGRYLALQRFRLGEAGVKAGIWLMEVETGDLREIAEAGRDPNWVP